MGKEDDNHIPFITVLVFTTLSIGFVMGSALIFEMLEKDWDYVSSLYFVVITMSTIGYGDLTPKTRTAKIFAIVFIFISLFILFAVFQALINFCVNKQLRRVKQRLRKRMRKRVTVANESLLVDDDILDEGEESPDKVNCCHLGCLHEICESSGVAIIFYILVYAGWLTIWVFYFTRWNKKESQRFNIFNAIYFGIVTSSTVGFGDKTPVSGNNGEIFTLCWAIVGVVLLATLAGAISNYLLTKLFHLCSIKIKVNHSCFAKLCCDCHLCEFVSTTEDEEWQLTKETIVNIKQNGAIDLRTFLAMEYSKDENFIRKLEAGCDKFDTIDTDGSKAIEFEELKAHYQKRKQLRQSSNNSNNSMNNNNNFNNNNNNNNTGNYNSGAQTELVVNDPYASGHHV